MITDRTTPAPSEPSLLDAVEASGDTRALSDAEADAILSVLFSTDDARLAHVCPYCNEPLGNKRIPSGQRWVHPTCDALYQLEEKVLDLESRLVDLSYRVPA